MGKLLILGTVAFDTIETPFGKAEKILGGSATYIGLSASNFDVQSAIISVVGGDFPEKYLQIFKKKKVNTEGIEIVKEGKTFSWSGRYRNDMNFLDTLKTDLNVLEDFNPIVPKKFRESEIVLLGNLSPLLQNSVLEQMEIKPKLVVLDTMNFWMDIALKELKEVIKKVDVITINDIEARKLSGEYSLVLASKKILEMGPKYVIIKKGEHGALLFFGEQAFFAPALPLETVFDPTGAGDTFAGGFAGYLSKTEDISFVNMKKAVIYGSNLASFCVEKFGTEQIQNLKKQEIRQRLQQFKELTQYELSIF